MGLISRFLGKLFGKQQAAEPVKPIRPATDYIARLEKEREERMKAVEQRLKEWAVASVQEKGTLPFSWESGNDEAFVTFADCNDAESGKFEDLEEYIIDKLEIPDAGEFQMNGSGVIYIDGNSVKAKYSSVMKGIIDYNEETEEEIYSEEELDNGDKVLFLIA